MKICKDGRIWGQNNKEAGEHLGILTGHQYNRERYKRNYIRKETPNGKGTPNRRGELNPMYGKHHTPEVRKKMSAGKRGNKNPFWKGGKDSEARRIRQRIEYRLWREAVFARDNWTCQKCEERGGKLHSHHIKSFAEYPELRFAIDNGETLCQDCHKLTDSYIGRSQWTAPTAIYLCKDILEGTVKYSGSARNVGI